MSTSNEVENQREEQRLLVAGLKQVFHCLKEKYNEEALNIILNLTEGNGRSGDRRPRLKVEDMRELIEAIPSLEDNFRQRKEAVHGCHALVVEEENICKLKEAIKSLKNHIDWCEKLRAVLSFGEEHIRQPIEAVHGHEVGEAFQEKIVSLAGEAIQDLEKALLGDSLIKLLGNIHESLTQLQLVLEAKKINFVRMVFNGMMGIFKCQA